MRSNRKSHISQPRGRAWLLGAAVLAVTGLLIARAAETLPAPANGMASQPMDATVTFVPVDMYVDAGSHRLGAYQAEIVAKDATIVGLEGGDAKAFADAPYYDPAALQGKRIVVASFSTDDDLPAGRTRVARLHLMVEGPLKPGTLPDLIEQLVVATDGEGHALDARLSLEPTPMQGATR